MDLREQKVFIVFFIRKHLPVPFQGRGLKYNDRIQFRYLAILFLFPYKRLFRRIY